MESLMEFIVQNIFFVVIVIGGLISLFNRMSGNGQEEQKKQQRQQRPEQRQAKVDWREIFKQEEADTKPDRPREPTFSSSSQEGSRDSSSSTTPQFDRGGIDDLLGEQQQLQDRYEEARLRKEQTTRRIREERTHHSFLDEKSNRSSGSLDLQLNRLSNKEAMKAVVWSEVLGRPRGRQPHSTFARKR